MRISPRRVVASVLAVATASLGLAVVGITPASAACAPRSSHYLAGIVMGQDHRHLNVQISFDVKDRYGHTIDMNGCRTGAYSKTIWMNMNVSGDGASPNSLTPYKWRLSSLPANAVSSWIEVYTRTNTGKLCPTCDGVIDTHRYGFINRRSVPLNHSYTLIAPLQCRVSGGSSGAIQGRLTAGGRPVRFDRLYAWSELTPDGSKPMQGWAIGLQPTAGYYKFNNLASGQSYVVRATYRGTTVVRKHIAVGACKAVPLSLGV